MAKHAQDSYILDLVFNGLQLDLKKFHYNKEVARTKDVKELSHPSCAKETYIVALETKKLLSKKVIVGSIPGIVHFFYHFHFVQKRQQ